MSNVYKYPIMDKKKVMPEIDFSPLLREGKSFVVHCTTEDDAINFLRCLRSAYPDKFSNWEEGETYWRKYKKAMCYRPRLNMPGINALTYANLEFYLSEGCTVVPYEDLIIQSDIKESEQRFDLLLS